MSDDTPFWKRKSLAQMTAAEWESVCDGCGQCCLHKLEDVDTAEVALTNVACSLLNLGTCQCSDYGNRKALVPDCVQLAPDTVRDVAWLPETCGYRLLDSGQELAWWHPLVSGDPATVHEAGISVRGQAISEDKVGDIEDHVVAWLNAGAKPFRPKPPPAPRKRKRR